MASASGFPLPMQSDNFRRLRTPISAVLCRGMEGVGRYSPDGRGSHFWEEKSPKWMSRRNTRSDYRRICAQSHAEWIDHFIGFRCLARWFRIPEGSLGSQPRQAIQALEKGDRGNVIPVKLRFGNSKGGQLPFIRHSKGLPAFSACSRDERLVHISLRRMLLPLYRTSFRVGKVTTLVHKLHGCVRERVALTLALPRASISR